MHWFQELIISTFNATKSTRKGWLTRNCPCCVFRGETADRRHRLGYRSNTETVGFGLNCFNCAFKATWKVGDHLSKSMRQYLSSVGYNDTQIAEINFRLYKEESVTEAEVREITKTYHDAWHKVELPPQTMSISEWTSIGESSQELIDVITYAASRKLYCFDKLYWSKSEEYKGRLIIPLYHKTKLVGYSGRYVYPSPYPSFPKYLDNRPDNYVFNLSAQGDYSRRFVIYPEGIIDAMHFDGICTFGNKLSPGQAEMINKLNKEIVFVPDYDEAGEVLVERAIENKWLVSLPDWNYKDISESVEARGKIITLRQILDSTTDDPFRIKLKWKMIMRQRIK